MPSFRLRYSRHEELATSFHLLRDQNAILQAQVFQT
jgi:hypothetical protein